MCIKLNYGTPNYANSYVNTMLIDNYNYFSNPGHSLLCVDFINVVYSWIFYEFHGRNSH